MSAVAVFTIVACSAGVQLRPAGGVSLVSARPGDSFAEWSTVVIPETDGKPFVTVRHESGKEESFTGAMTFSLDTQSFHGDLRSGRTVSRSPLVSPAAKESSLQGPVDRVLAYFLDAREESSDKRLASIGETWKRNPIMPIFPPVVHVVTTATLPVTLNFEWEVQGAQKEPHKLFVWTEDYMSYSPVAVVHGGKAQMQFTTYGKFFWQLEDANGVYASIPRTIIVKEVGEQNARTKLEQGRGGTFPLLFPNKDTKIISCFEKKGVRIPLSFLHRNRDIVRYSIETRPALKGIHGKQLLAGPDDVKLETSIFVKGEVDFFMRVIPIYSIGKYAEMPPDKVEASDFARVQVKNICSVTAAAREMIPTGGNVLPDTGTVIYYD